MFGNDRRRRIGALCAAAVLGAVVLASGIASGASRPTIVGSPVVGITLGVSVSAPGFNGLYQWQSCNPAVANCSDSLAHNDPNWTDLPPISTDRHNNTNYTIVSADLGHFIRVLVKDNSLGNGTWVTSPPIGPVIAGSAPQHGISVLVKPAGGTVKVKKPGQRGFSDLKKLETIPVKSVVDTRGGRVEVTAATGNLGDTTADNSVVFYDGLLRLQQGKEHNAPATAKLVEKLDCPENGVGGEAKAGKSSGPVATTARKRRRRSAWGSGSGGYSTAGSGGTGSVRGTTWLTKDTCRGTFFRVTEGIGITVTDFDRGEQVELGPGQSYFARNR